jgi:hypothetical protein
MESTGQAGKIQASASTAKLLMDAGKASWIRQREGGVDAKGKGRLVTYWVQAKGAQSSSISASSDSNHFDEKAKGLFESLNYTISEGLFSRRDLENYEPIVNKALATDVDV